LTPIDSNLVQKKLAIIIENLKALELIQSIPPEEYSKDIYKRKATERMLQELIEAAIDVNFHIIVESDKTPPDDYYQSFIKLGELGVISLALAQELAPSAGLRNRLVHEYDLLDNKTVLQSVRSAQNLFSQYIKAISNHLK
jgi:uncharacterized protein YutE (UPF0331/DUF86 family)